MGPLEDLRRRVNRADEIFRFGLGVRLRDTLTGFEGVSTGRFEYVNGCVRYMLEKLSSSGELVETIFDEDRLEGIPTAEPAEEVQARTRERTGGPHASPARPAPAR